MKFTQATSMALHVMTYLVQHAADQQNIGLKEMAARFGVSPTYLSKILTRLTKAGLITSVPGAHGGYRLAKSADTIVFTDVIAAIEGPQPGASKQPGDTPQCEIIATVAAAEEAGWRYLASKRLVDLQVI